MSAQTAQNKNYLLKNKEKHQLWNIRANRKFEVLTSRVLLKTYLVKKKNNESKSVLLPQIFKRSTSDLESSKKLRYDNPSNPIIGSLNLTKELI